MTPPLTDRASRRWLALAAALIACSPATGAAVDGAATTAGRSVAFKVSSPVMTDGGQLPVRFTCDGSSVNPSIRWTGAPKGTRSFAVVMHHVPGPGDVHWYWVVYGLSATVDHLAEASSAVGTLGTNSVNGRNEYRPPCSKGPGPKAYTLTVYALSAAPRFRAGTAVSRELLLGAIERTTLASSSMTVTYSRPGSVVAPAPPPPRRDATPTDTTVPRS